LLPAPAEKRRQPGAGRQGGGDVGDGVPAGAAVQLRPQLLVAADGQHEGLPAPLELPAEPAVRAVDLVAQHPGAGQARIQRPTDHPRREHRLGGEGDLLRDGRLGPLGLVLAPPLPGKVEFAVDQRVALAAGVGEEDADPGILDPARGAAVLPRHPGRVLALLQEPGLVHDEHPIRRAEMLPRCSRA
jgi:hypothetical protein